MEQQIVSGCLFGLAFGDALAAPCEFLSVDEICQRHPPNGPLDLEGNPALVTDDTQMALALGRALLDARATRTLSPADLEYTIGMRFTEWLHSPDNNRAPGRTCLRAIAGLDAGLPWLRATQLDSKGCGANMRVAAVGLLPSSVLADAAADRAAIAQFQAALTHGHATALAASDLTTAAVHFLARGGSQSELLEWLRCYGQSQRRVYHGDWLGSLWQRPWAASAEDFIAGGWDECLTALQRVEDGLQHADRDTDPCLVSGDGWIAEEALATALLCILWYPDEPRRALRRAAVTRGDSDSIACLAGAFAGAVHGIKAWPADWRRRIEYNEQLETLSKDIADLA